MFLCVAGGELGCLLEAGGDVAEGGAVLALPFAEEALLVGADPWCALELRGEGGHDLLDFAGLGFHLGGEILDCLYVHT